jgi:hypothetical protein
MEIRCPQCDAVIKTGIEHKVVKCPYCSTHLYYEKDKVLTKESIKPNLGLKVAESLLSERINKKLKLELEYFPFYRIKTQEKTIFLPGRETDLIGINSYIPQGDRITLEKKIPPPELSVEEVLEKIEKGKDVESIGLIYFPFYTAKDEDTIYYIDGTKGIILSDKLEKKVKNEKNHYPFALISFVIIVLVALFFPTLPFRLISIAVFTSLLWYYDKGRQNG